MKRRLALSLLFSFLSVSLFSQESDRDSLFRLVSAERAEQMVEFGLQFRRVTGNADFFHNNTHLYCDSASWNVEYKKIEAFGNVRLVQDNTMLTSEQLVYNIDENVAHFRGGVVQLVDKEGNTLRTFELDYNTKDSIGYYRNGGAMMDRDSNVIESSDGIYRSVEKTFTFENNVQMYMDSIRISTSSLNYRTDNDIAYFGPNTYMWKDDGFLKADAGWYDKNGRVACFTDSVFADNPSYEAWTDKLMYYQGTGEVRMHRNSQILDTTNKSYYTADYIRYERDSLDGRLTMTDNPAIIYYGQNENTEVDTLWVASDTLLTYTVRKCDIPEEEVKESGKRLSDIMYDTLQKKREELAEAKRKETEEKLRQAGLLPPGSVNRDQDPPARDSSSSEPPAPDSMAVEAVADTLQALPDTSSVRYLFAWYNVRAYRSKMQARCDSLAYFDLDSIARLYGRPILWNEIRNQITSEQMNILFKGGNLDRGSMITDSWVISQADSTHFNQIKSTEMMGYFKDNQLYRFDALGGVSAIFYLDEDGVLTTVNVKESKMMSAMIRDGNARRMLYMESLSSNAYPVNMLPAEQHRLKQFEWRADERPTDPSQITGRKLHCSERGRYVDLIPPYYFQVNRFFDNCMKCKFPNPGSESADDSDTESAVVFPDGGNEETPAVSKPSDRLSENKKIRLDPALLKGKLKE